MRNNRGITLTSLIIYVIAMSITVGAIGTLTGFFFKNVDVDNIKSDETTQFAEFSSVFTEEINSENNYVVDCKTLELENGKESYIIFASGNQYTFKSENNSIYKNKVKICENVDDCDFSYSFVDSQYLIRVDFKNSVVDMTGENAVTFVL